MVLAAVAVIIRNAGTVRETTVNGDCTGDTTRNETVRCDDNNQSDGVSDTMLRTQNQMLFQPTTEDVKPDAVVGVRVAAVS